MSKIKIGDIVAITFPGWPWYKPDARDTCYLKVIDVRYIEEYEKNYVFGEEYNFLTGETNHCLHSLWEDDVKLVDMKGANI